ncbi:MAG: DNA polymerase/3'-5' exonuclease PolX [Acidimicrobiia bacterium]|nr:DNA polymerase/3'-5' exonuclease PolX [Acidimicrobiia bacterium]
MATNRELVRVIREYAELMKLEEGSPQAFRVRAYDKAADALGELVEPAAEMSMAELQKLDGVGKATAGKIQEYVRTGSIEKLEKLREKYPPALVELTRIPGLGPKTVLLLRDKLNVNNVEDLKAALAAEQLRELPGMGAKSEEKIAKAIDRLGLHGKDRRTPIIKVLPIANEVVEAMREVKGVKAAEYAGSLRRFSDTIGDVDVLVAAAKAEPVMEAFVQLPIVHSVEARGDTKTTALTADGLQIDVRVVAPGEFGAAMLYFTGSKAHNIELRQLAIDRGWTLNEYELADVETGKAVAARTENAIYKALGLKFVEPEMREGVGEVAAAAAGELPSLVSVEDIVGDLHVHSTWSGDGRSSLDDMIRTAAERGLSYIAMTEHAENLAINGLSREQVKEEAIELARLRETYPHLTIMQGSELNIGPDGSLDYDHDFLMAFDWCVASVHSHFDLPQADQTERVLTAIAHPAVNVIGHLTGRRIGKRPGIEVDIDAVFDAAADTGTALEINCHLDRLDVPADMLRRARDRTDVNFVISTDSHHVNEFANVRWGVHNARRGWVQRKYVANTWPKERFLKWANRKRNNA